MKTIQKKGEQMISDTYSKNITNEDVEPISVANNNESELIPNEVLDEIVDIFKTLMKWDEELNALSEAA